MKKKLSALLACIMVVSGLGSMPAYAFEYDTNAYMEEYYSKEVDYSLWDKFIKYDLCITDYDSLTDEQKSLCEFIFETERSAQGTIRCERARRILKGEDVGERLTLEAVTSTRGGIIDPTIKTPKGTYNKYVIAVPDIMYLDSDAAETSEYWLDDNGNKRILFSGWYLDYGYVEFGEELTESNEYLTDITYSSDAGIVCATIEFNEEIVGDDVTINGWNCHLLPDGSIGICGGYSDFADTTLVIPDEIDGNAVSSFFGYFCENDIKSVVSSENLRYISAYTFTNNTFLEEAIINSPCATIGSKSFKNSALKTVDINAKHIEEYAFSKCAGLESLTLHESVELIDNEAFEGCEALETVVFPETLKVIGEGAFLNTGIKSVEIPATVEIIGALDEPIGDKVGMMGENVPPTDPLTEEALCVFDSDCVISGWYGTEAHSYALQNNLAFKALDENIAYGDTNKDGNVDVSDLVMLQRYLIKLDDSIGYEADVNKDGRINAFDMVAVRRNVCEIS